MPRSLGVDEYRERCGRGLLAKIDDEQLGRAQLEPAAFGIGDGSCDHSRLAREFQALFRSPDRAEGVLYLHCDPLAHELRVGAERR